MYLLIYTIFVLENLGCTSLPMVLAWNQCSINSRSRLFEMSSYEWMSIVETIISLRNALSFKSLQTWLTLSPGKGGVGCSLSQTQQCETWDVSTNISQFFGLFILALGMTMLKVESRGSEGHCLGCIYPLISVNKAFLEASLIEFCIYVMIWKWLTYKPLSAKKAGKVCAFPVSTLECSRAKGADNGSGGHPH